MGLGLVRRDADDLAVIVQHHPEAKRCLDEARRVRRLVRVWVIGLGLGLGWGWA